MLEYLAVSWSILEYPGVSCSILEYHGVSWSILEYPGVSYRKFNNLANSSPNGLEILKRDSGSLSITIKIWQSLP